MLALIIALSLVRFPEVRAATPAVVVSSVYNLTEPGTVLLINITVNDVSELMMWLIDLVWDPSMMQLNTGSPTGLLKKGVRYDIFEGSFLKSIRSTVFTLNSINLTGGKIGSLAAGYLTPGTAPSGSGTLVTMNFTVISVGTTMINMTGPSTAQPGRSMLIGQDAKEIPHDDVQGVITKDGPPPPPPFWTQLWFQAGAIIVIVAVVAGYVVIKRVIPARARAKAREAEEIVEEEIEEDFL